MSKVQLIITIENDEQADKVLAVLNEAEAEMQLDFAFDVERRDEKNDPRRIQPTYTVGKDGEPMM